MGFALKKFRESILKMGSARSLKLTIDSIVSSVNRFLAISPIKLIFNFCTCAIRYIMNAYQVYKAYIVLIRKLKTFLSLVSYISK